MFYDSDPKSQEHRIIDMGNTAVATPMNRLFLEDNVIQCNEKVDEIERDRPANNSLGFESYP